MATEAPLCPVCGITHLVTHCPTTNKHCRWVRCRHCSLVIDRSAWRAISSRTGQSVQLPPAKK